MDRRTFLLAGSAAALTPRWASAATPTGSGVYERAEISGATNEPQRVFFHRPASWKPDRRVVFVMHGLGRNADGYRDAWAPLADRYGFLLICPEFSNSKYPRSAWHTYGGWRETDDPQRRAFAVPDRVFAELPARFGVTATKYSLYGHSAGAQFTHRYLLLAPSTNVDQAIAANAGWYTMPVFDQPFPYGLAGTGLTPDDVRRFLTRPLVLQLGEADTDPDHESLRRNASADRQGLHRYARGLNYMAVAKREAEALGVRLAWRVVTVPGADHDNNKMAASAAAVLFS